MRRVGGWVLAVIGGLLAVGGLAGAVVVGPDDAIGTGTHHLESAGGAIVSAPGALDVAGPTLRLDVESAGGDVFVGVGREVDVADLVGDVSRTEVDGLGLRSDPRQSAVEGDVDALAAGDAGLDWWVATGTGQPAEVSLVLPEQRMSLVVMNADGSAGVDVEVTAAVSIAGLFAGTIAAVVVGVGLALTGGLLLTRRRRAALGDAA